MIFDLIDKRIRKAFSSAAMKYDALTSLHKEIGRELTKKLIKCESSTSILDIGMGTGWYTNRLTNIFPEARVVGIDFASGMIEKSLEQEGNFKIVQADALHIPFKANSFDIITSNLAYQWVGNLSQSFDLCHSQLKKEGVLCLTMFGHDTFDELFTALNASAPHTSKAIARLATDQQVQKALALAGFKSIVCSSENIKVRFPDMMSLMRWVKDIGANALPREVFLGKDLLLKANDYYNEHFVDRLGVYATFEVIWVEAIK